LKNGKMAVIDTGAVEELQEVLLDCAPQQNAQGYRISSKQAGFSKQPCSNTRIGRCKRPPRGAIAQRSKAVKQGWSARRSAIWKVCCVRIKSKAWRGWVFCARTASVEFWPTKWA